MLYIVFVILFQAQALLAKNIFYQKIDVALKQLTCFQPAVYNNVTRTTTDSEVVSAIHRDAAISNLRLLNIFCNNSPITFARSVSLFDRLLGQVKVCFLMNVIDVVLKSMGMRESSLHTRDLWRNCCCAFDIN